MALPTFRSLGGRRKNENAAVPADTAAHGNTAGVVKPDESSDRTLTPAAAGAYTPGVNIKTATKTRKIWIILSSLLFVISVVFLILVRSNTDIKKLPTSLTNSPDNHRQHKRQGRDPRHLLLLPRPNQHPPVLRRRHRLRQLARPLPRPARFLPSRPLGLLRRLQQRRHNLLLAAANALLLQPRHHSRQ